MNADEKMAELKLLGEYDYFTQEAYKFLRTNLQFCGDDVRIVALTSCHENEGKTTIALNLAKSLAELDKKVLLIDADMRKSVMAGRNATVKNTAGLSEVLSGLTDKKDVVYFTQYKNFHVMFAGKYPPNPAELLGCHRFDALLAEMRSVYEYIILDLPPLGHVIDAAVVAPKCDGTILVLDAGNVRYRNAQDVVRQLEKSGGKILGVVRNHADKKSDRYYAGKGYYRKNKYYRNEEAKTEDDGKDVFEKRRHPF